MISIIVPVYKTEQYLKKCVDSILNQTYTDFELILVDDGTPDNGGKICDAYQEADSRVIVIHKPNGGLSDARNAGIQIAKGEYITFADSDDWAEPELLEVLYEGIRQGARVSACGFYTIRDGNKKPWREPFDAIRIVSSVDAVKDMMYGHSIDTSAWGKLFHRSCFDEIRFPTGHVYEEVATTYRLMLTQDKTAITTRPLYNYVKHSDSIVTSGFSLQDMDMLRFSGGMLDYARNNEPSLIPAGKRRMVYACCFLLKTMGRQYQGFPQETEQILRTFQEYKGEVFRDPEVSRRDKAAILLLSIGPGFFTRAWGIYSALTGRHGNA